MNHPPAFIAGGGDNPVVGLDATGRRRLWSLAIGCDVTPRDIHDTDRERQAFLRDVYGLRMLQTSPHVNSYEGDPSGKNFDDTAVVRETAEAYGKAELDSGATLDDAPAVVTTKVVEETVADLEDVAEQSHDVESEGLHVDIYRDGEKVGTESVAGPLPADEAFNYAEEHLMAHLEQYVQRFEGWHGIRSP